MKHVDDGTLQEIVRRLVTEFQPEAILLFGSHAWGTPTTDRDLDLLVIVSESDEEPTARATRGHLGFVMLFQTASSATTLSLHC